MKLHHVGIVIENKEILEFASEKTIRNKIIDNNQNNYIYFDYDNSKKFGLNIFVHIIKTLQFLIF